MVSTKKMQRKENIKHTRTMYPKINKNKIYDLASVKKIFTFFFLENFDNLVSFFLFKNEKKWRKIMKTLI